MRMHHTNMNENILLIRLSSLGDIVLTSPAIRAVRRHYPKARISMLVIKKFADLLTENPHLDEVITLNRTARNREIGEMTRVARLLRRRNFDLAIDFQRKLRSSLLSYLSGSKRRVGNHQPNGLMCTIRVPDHVNKHAIDRNFDLLYPLGIEPTDRSLELFLSDTDRAHARNILVTKGVNPKRLTVGMFPGAGWKLRKWMPDRFAAIGDRIINDFDAQVLIFGGPNEGELVNQVARLMPVRAIPFAEALPIRHFAALVEACNLFITNDTGPMHIAAAVQTPTVALFGPGNHIRFQPLEPIHSTLRHHVPCNPCKQFTDKCKDNICMKLIAVDEVWDTVQKKLTEMQPSTRE